MTPCTIYFSPARLQRLTMKFAKVLVNPEIQYRCQNGFQIVHLELERSNIAIPKWSMGWSKCGVGNPERSRWLQVDPRVCPLAPKENRNDPNWKRQRLPGAPEGPEGVPEGHQGAPRGSRGNSKKEPKRLTRVPRRRRNGKRRVFRIVKNTMFFIVKMKVQRAIVSSDGFMWSCVGAFGKL